METQGKQKEEAMQKKNIKTTKGRNSNSKQTPNGVSYRLKCAKTANGLSHFVMYGDVSKDKTIL
jgi:hypothetical protein